MINKALFNFLIALIFLSMLNFVSAEMLTSETGVGYDSEILDEFAKIKTNETNQTFVNIIIDLKNSSKADEILSVFSEDELFHIIKRDQFSDRISARITEQGFNKLIQDDRVEKVYYNAPIYAFLSESIPLINVTQAWNNLNYTGNGIKVCVIDSGINWTHPDLGGCLGTGCKVLGGHNYYNNNNNPMDDNEHGTNVAGIMAAKRSINGTAPDAKIISMKD